MIVCIIFAILLLFVLTYYAAHVYSSYKMAGIMAEALGGSPVFTISRSYMQRHYEGIEERAWVVPDDKMAWGSILTITLSSNARLILKRCRSLGFNFNIERKSGVLFRAISLGALKAADFNVSQLDEILQLQTDAPAEAARYFGATDKQQALMALFDAGFVRIKGRRNAITAIQPEVTRESISPESLKHYFTQLRRL